MKTRFLTISAILGMVLLSLTFGSCKDEEEWGNFPDGDTFLHWFREGAEFEFSNTDVNVDPAQESTYPLVCVYPEEFSKVVIKECEVDGISLQPTEDNPQIIEWDWFTIDLDGKKMTVSFKPNDTGKKRVLYLRLVASDYSSGHAPCIFTFTQVEKKEVESEEAEE